MLKRLLRPRAVLPMGFAIGLLVLWELGALPAPFGTDPGPIGLAGYAVGLAVVGAVVGFFAQWLFSKVAGGSKAPSSDEE